MNTTPKAGINYAKLRKQKSKEDGIFQKNMMLKNRSTSQHSITQIQLFDQYFNTKPQQDNFLDFLDRQIVYHQSQQPIINIYRKKHDEERKKMIQEISNCRQETAYYQREIHELKKAKVLLSKRCELLQELIVKERLGQSVHKEIYKNNQMPISETVSSLADEKFESYETQLNSSLSNDDEMSPRQFMQLIKSRYNHNNFMKA
ncbi:hypothetical protein pb186bvf_020249 [Paramecium bursaria]